MIELNITGNFKIVYVFVYCNIYLAFMKNLFVFLFLFYVSSNYSEAQTTAHKFEAGKNTFLLDGKPFVVKAAELHYTRIPQAYWEHRIEMCKALGMNTGRRKV